MSLVLSTFEKSSIVKHYMQGLCSAMILATCHIDQFDIILFDTDAIKIYTSAVLVIESIADSLRGNLTGQPKAKLSS